MGIAKGNLCFESKLSVIWLQSMPDSHLFSNATAHSISSALECELAIEQFRNCDHARKLAARKDPSCRLECMNLRGEGLALVRRELGTMIRSADEHRNAGDG